MARFNAQTVDNYGGNGEGSSFFQLKNDKDTARVRFMYNNIDDVEGYAVHEVEVNGKKRYVNCLREYNQPISDCPFCAAQRKQLAKLFVPLYDLDSDQIKIWERGKKFFSKLSSICSRYPNVVSHVFEIERNGKPKDTATTYEIYEVEKDDITFDDLPEVPVILGGLVLDKSAEEMQYYLDYDCFPDGDNSTEDETPRRRGGESTGRRTPATSNRRGDRF